MQASYINIYNILIIYLRPVDIADVTFSKKKSIQLCRQYFWIEINVYFVIIQETLFFFSLQFTDDRSQSYMDVNSTIK